MGASASATKRTVSAYVTHEIYDRVRRAAMKTGETPCRYLSEFITQNIDIIDPEGAEPAEQDS